MSFYNRKEFIKTFVKGIGCYSVAASIPFTSVLNRQKVGRRNISFPQGLASGDPTPESVVLWTRAVDMDKNYNPIDVIVQVSETPSFASIVAEKECEAKSESDYTVRVIVHNLEPDTRYYYRFIADNNVPELTGRTKTAPAPDSNKNVKLAIASCQSFESGYYHAYRALIKEDENAPEKDQIDFVLHLGDFIYETLGYGSARKLPGFPSGGNVLDENVEWARAHAVTLEDYRFLYKQYLMDPDLKEARARWPFIVTWDDHEFTDDSWQGVSTYSVPDIPAQERKIAANQAWFEYIPAFLTGLADSTKTSQEARDFQPAEVKNAILGEFDEYGLNREPNNKKAIESLTIYRSFKWGKHVELFVTDTRSYRSKHPVPGEIALEISGNARYIAPVPLVKISDAGKSYNNGNPPSDIKIGENRIPNRRKESPPGTILGKKQKMWLKSRIGESEATWNLIATSVPMMPMRLDMQNVDPNAAPVIFTTDTWEGYLTEREELLSFVKELNRKNLISLSGDNHNSFAGVLSTDFENQTSEIVGAEFSVCGISSTSVFQALFNIVEKDSAMRPLITYNSKQFGGSDEAVENLNTAFLWGTKAALAAAKTGDTDQAKQENNPLHNHHLRYVDSAANGIGVVTVTAESVTGEFITLPPPLKKLPSSDPRILRKAVLEYSAGNPDANEKNDLKLHKVEGIAPHPLT